MTTRTGNEHHFYIGVGDLLPLLQEYLFNDDDTPLDCTNATSVGLFLWRYDSGVRTVVLDDEPATFLDLPNGLVQYAFASGETDVAGEYERRWKVMFNTLPVSVPNDRQDGYPVIMS